jgi:hypothetical protein
VPSAESADIHTNAVLQECEVLWLSDRWAVEITAYDNDLAATCPED